ncbi:MAG: aminotransferase class V-fold PLP-dependent enzyme [Thermomicrobiales bacterium]
MTSVYETPEQLRTQFLLDPDIAFLNHGSFGACPSTVFDIYQSWQRQLEWEPVRFVGNRQEGLLDAARHRLAGWLNADPACLTFITNATSGINVVARSLDIRPGDEILTTNLEYGACDNTWQHLCDRFGASYVHQMIPVPFTTKQAVIDALFGGVTPRTKAIYVSHLTSGTAVILPVREICAKARALGILSIVDGAHAPGQIPVDLAEIGADFYTGNLHKWTCAPKGSAFLFARPEHHSWTESLTISWGWSRGGDTFVSRNQQQGTQDVARYLAVPAAIDFLEEHHWDQVRLSTHGRLRTLRDRLHEYFGTERLYPEDGDWYAQLGLISLPIADVTNLNARMYSEFAVEVPFTSHDGRTFVRVSMQGYVTDSDLDRFETALKTIVS